MVTKIKKLFGLVLCYIAAFIIDQFLEARGFVPGQWLSEAYDQMNTQIPEEIFSQAFIILAALLLYYSEVRFKWIENIFSRMKITEIISPKQPTVQPHKQSETIKERDWNIRDALEWWVELTGLEMGAAEILDFFRDLRQEARDGNLMVWGRLNSEHWRPSEYTEPLQPISKEHWGNYDFDKMLYISSDDRDDEAVRMAATPPGTDPVSSGTRYVDLCLTSIEVKKIWPASNKAKREYYLMVDHKEGHPDYQQLDRRSDGSIYWLYRISILNENGDPLDNLQVYLSEIEPRHINIKGLPRPFHVIHRNKPSESDDPVVRVGDIPKFFDIISIPQDLEKPMAIIFANIFPGYSFMPNTEYKLTLDIVVDDKIILQKQYELVRNSDYITNYRFTKVD